MLNGQDAAPLNTMTMRRVVFFLVLIFFSQLLSAQPRRSVFPRGEIPAVYADYLRPDTVSVDEMVESYKAVKAGMKPQLKVTDYDGSMAGRTVFSESLLAGQPLFVGRPLVAEWANLSLDSVNLICLTELYRRGTFERDTAAWAEADRALGVSVDEPGLSQRRVVPARWLNGTFVRVSDALPYFGFVVGRSRVVQSVRDGRWERPCVSDTYRAYYTAEAASYRDAVNPEWTDNVDLAMILLSHDVTQATPVDSALWKNARWFDLLLTIDTEGRMDVVLLHADGRNADPALDQRCVDGLRQILRTLPPYALEPLYTADGRVFPGRYVRALRSLDEWKITDYLENSYNQYLIDRKREEQRRAGLWP